MQRTKRSILNVSVSLMTDIVIMGSAFIVQRYFLHTLGSEYNGINGLFTRIITMLSLADMGIGSAIIYHLYKPVAEEDYDTINTLLHFYKKCYMVIAAIVLIAGMLIAVFLPQMVVTTEIQDNIYLIFGLFLIDCLCSYFLLAYRRSLLYAYQKNYVLDSVHFCCYMVQVIVQIFVLLHYKSYIAFLITKTTSKCVENIIIALYINSQYKFTKVKAVKPLDHDIQKDIVKKVKALLFHKIGAFFVQGSDSIVITIFLGLTVMGKFTNYEMIRSGAAALINKMFETLTASVGNFLLDSDTHHRYEVYKNIDFINFWLFGCTTVILYCVLRPLITLWIGQEYLFSSVVVFVYVINFYIQGMKASILTFKNGAGIFFEDRKVPLAEAVINVALSIALAKPLGVIGVMLGTIISSGVWFLYSYPKYVCAPLLGMRYKSYIWLTLQHLLFVIAVLVLSRCAIDVWNVDHMWMQLIINILVPVSIFHVMFFVVYGRSKPMKYFIGLIKMFAFSK